MPKLSICVISQNEQDVLEACLQSVSWADEIVVVDSGSTDKTLEIAKKYNAKIVHNDWPGFGPQRQVAEKHASNDWIFAIDCDEVVSEKLKNEILNRFSPETLPRENVYYVNRLTKLFGKFLHYGEMHPDRIARIYNKTFTGYNDLLVHEKVKVDGANKIQLQAKLLHYYKSTYQDYCKKLHRYAQDSANEKHLAGKTSNYFDAYFRAYYAFVKNYIFKLGFLDGKQGLMIAKARYQYTYDKYDLLIKKGQN